MTACGYTPAEIDEMTLYDILALFSYWRDYPPAHEILKCVHRIERKPQVVSSKSAADPSGIGGLIARYPDGFVRAAEGG
ncbi:conserved hypothetical protein [Methylocella tundrae]|uniref:Uncharacterized protein n=1 Tax=Methylocella tundrae TaxID=227605 RepID=A0A8B6M342_METTU|nr:hypothetical protein [Methylocella tundrae]VTZ23242.1 conserved hypothetical protein [Methylocella tundrae]VTZ49256.1 conserved hypothetical protein [Methylocella tundrae]